jgi:hypothetical protein
MREHTRALALLFFYFIVLIIMPPAACAEKAVGPDFLLIQPHARTAAMGNAFTGVADDSNAVLFNPAGIALQNKNSVSMTHYSSFADTNYEYLMFASPQGRWGFGGGALFDYTSDFTEINTAGQENGQVNNYDFMLAGSFAYLILPGFSAGISAKYFKSELLNFSKDGYAFDFGLLVKLTECPDIYAGMVLQNLGDQTAYEQEKDDLPLLFRAGIGLKHKINDALKITAAADLGRVLLNKYLPDLGAGTELCLYNMYFLSAGFGFKQEGDSFSFGAGFMPVETLKLAYAFQPFENLGATHRISLDVFF